MNINVRILCEKSWCSMMVENSRYQGRMRNLHGNLSHTCDNVRMVMDVSQRWSDTPQGHDYWIDIAQSL